MVWQHLQEIRTGSSEDWGGRMVSKQPLKKNRKAKENSGETITNDLKYVLNRLYSVEWRDRIVDPTPFSWYISLWWSRWWICLNIPQLVLNRLYTQLAYTEMLSLSIEGLHGAISKTMFISRLGGNSYWFIIDSYS